MSALDESISRYRSSFGGGISLSEKWPSRYGSSLLAASALACSSHQAANSGWKTGTQLSRYPACPDAACVSFLDLANPAMKSHTCVYTSRRGEAFSASQRRSAASDQAPAPLNPL